MAAIDVPLLEQIMKRGPYTAQTERTPVEASFVQNETVLGTPSDRTSTSQAAGKNVLANTSPAILRAVVQLGSLARYLNACLGVFTWTNENPWINILILTFWWTLYLHPVLFVRAIVPVSVWIIFYNGYGSQGGFHEDLQKDEDISKGRIELSLYHIDLLRARIDIVTKSWSDLLSAIHQSRTEDRGKSDLSGSQIIRMMLWPLVLTFSLSPNTLGFVVVTLALCWHSPALKVCRILLLRSATFRSVVSAVSGIDITIQSNSLRASERIFHMFKKRKMETPAETENGVVFPYILCENQRRWLGIGWTTSLFPNERAPWTDEVCGENCCPKENFVLPAPKTERVDDNHSKTIRWEWVDPHWSVANKPSLQSSGKQRGSPSKAKTAEPETDTEGWQFTDNYWRYPAARADMYKYTRSRKWARKVRTFEEITVEGLPLRERDDNHNVQHRPATPALDEKKGQADGGNIDETAQSNNT